MLQGSNFESFRLPKSIIEDLPKRSQGGLFWDVTEDPDLPGGPVIFLTTFILDPCSPGSHRSLIKTLQDLKGKQFEVDSLVEKEWGRCTHEDCGGFTNSATIDAERHLRHGEIIHC